MAIMAAKGDKKEWRQHRGRGSWKRSICISGRGPCAVQAAESPSLVRGFIDMPQLCRSDKSCRLYARRADDDLARTFWRVSQLHIISSSTIIRLNMTVASHVSLSVHSFASWAAPADVESVCATCPSSLVSKHTIRAFMRHSSD